MAGNMTSRVRNAMGRLRPVSPAPAIGAAIVVGIGLSQVYQGANADLTGARFVAAFVFGTVTSWLMIESFYRVREKKPWHTAGGAGVFTAVATVLLVFLPVSHGAAEVEDGGLRFSLRPTAPELFHVAMREPISLPSAREGWAQLRRRGGIDVGDSRFHMVLANETSEPISVLDVHAEVLGSEPMPHGTDALEASQGDEGIGQLMAVLSDDKKGSIGRVYDDSVQMLEPDELADAPSHFETKYISLKPGEAYPVALTVKADVPRTIEYRMIAEGESAERRFLVKTPAFRIVGGFEDPYQRRFARYYTKRYLPGDCTATPDNPWVDARYTAHSAACPHGLGRPYEVPLANPSRFPLGKLGVDLGLTPGEQSATISGIRVGREPAARPVPDVTLPLLRSLGAWDSCYRNSPEPDYWMARWESGLDLTFAAEGESDCTPASSAPVVEIELAESREVIHTDLGSIELGAPAAWLPLPIAEILFATKGQVERDLVAPGVSLCDPTQTVPNRKQLDVDSPGGIVALSDYQSANELTGFSTTLPYEGC